jgi:hypothetical protein
MSLLKGQQDEQVNNTIWGLSNNGTITIAKRNSY